VAFEPKVEHPVPFITGYFSWIGGLLLFQKKGRGRAKQKGRGREVVKKTSGKGRGRVEVKPFTPKP